VEDKSVLKLLEEMGGDRVQGFLYCKPLNFDLLKEWLSSYKNIE